MPHMPQPRIGYAGNVHPAETLSGLHERLRCDVSQVARACPGGRVGFELRTGSALLEELQAPQAREALAEALDAAGADVFTINAFPLRDFHAGSVKDDVYRPDWRGIARIRDTLSACRLLSDLLPEGESGTVSTSPGSFKPWGHCQASLRGLAGGVAQILPQLARWRKSSGRSVRLTVEPEPFCTLETVAEVCAFVEDGLRPALREAGRDADALIAEHFGVTLDACHLAVEFASMADALPTLARAGIPVGKVHVSAALELSDPANNAEGMRALRAYDEPRYLHQTFTADVQGRVRHRLVDLPAFFSLPPGELAGVARVRTHFHMPLFLDAVGALSTTAAEAGALARDALRETPDVALIAETYTWPVLPGGSDAGLAGSLAREVAWVREQVVAVREGV